MRHTVWIPDNLEGRIHNYVASLPDHEYTLGFSPLVTAALEEYLASRDIASRQEGPVRASLVTIEAAIRQMHELRALLVRQAAARDSAHRNQASLLEAPHRTEDP